MNGKMLKNVMQLAKHGSMKRVEHAQNLEFAICFDASKLLYKEDQDPLEFLGYSTT